MDPNLVFPKSEMLALLEGITGSTDYTGAKLGLFENDITPNSNTVLGDLTPATYSGYAAQTITWSDPFFDVQGQPVSSGGEKLFVQMGATGATIYGGFLTNSAGTKLLWAARIADAPFNLVDDGDVLPLAVKLGILKGLLSLADTPS